MLNFTQPIKCDMGPINQIIVNYEKGEFTGMLNGSQYIFGFDGQCLSPYLPLNSAYHARNAVESPSVDIDGGQPMWYHKKSHTENQMLIGFAKAALIGILSNSNRDIADENIPKAAWKLGSAMMINRPEEK